MIQCLSTEAGFWGGALAKPTFRWLPLSVLIAWAFALSVVVGPSSAIVLIPRLDFWDLSKSFFNTPDHKMNPTYILIPSPNSGLRKYAQKMLTHLVLDHSIQLS